jgi:hypothetical protein
MSNGDKRGSIDEAFAAMIERLISGDIQMIRQNQMQHGNMLGVLQERCASRGHHCSEQFRALGSRVGVAEDTGVHELAKLKASETARWGMLKWLAVPLLTAILGAAGMAGTLMLRKEKPADVVRVVKVWSNLDSGVIHESR